MKTKTKRQTPVRAACRPEVWRAGAVALRKAAKEIRRAISPPVSLFAEQTTKNDE